VWSHSACDARISSDNGLNWSDDIVFATGRAGVGISGYPRRRQRQDCKVFSVILTNHATPCNALLGLESGRRRNGYMSGPTARFLQNTKCHPLDHDGGACRPSSNVEPECSELGTVHFSGKLKAMMTRRIMRLAGIRRECPLQRRTCGKTPRLASIRWMSEENC